MGPIERELRCWPSTECRELFDWLWSPAMSEEAFELVTWVHRDDRKSVKDYRDDGTLPDVVSEAIEAAEALKL